MSHIVVVGTDNNPTESTDKIRRRIIRIGIIISSIHVRCWNLDGPDDDYMKTLHFAFFLSKIYIIYRSDNYNVVDQLNLMEHLVSDTFRDSTFQ